jgi:uncharacterized protein (TIGR00661 family)
MSTKRVLVAPLDWGLGHATRCIPIIEELLKRNHEVLIASSGSALKLLRKEFPALEFFALPPYKIRYPRKGSFIFSIALQTPRILSIISKEHKRVQKIVRDNKIDLILSDNRYGCWSEEIPSVFISHQLNLQVTGGWRLLKPIVDTLHNRMIKKFDQCWIPDDPKLNLAGALTKNDKLKVKHIGVLSRFKKETIEMKYDLAVVLSGPEPQRTMLEEIIFSQIEDQRIKIIIVRGVVEGLGNWKEERGGDLIIANFLHGKKLQEIMNQSKLIISRSGYSTIMDLARLEKKAILIPTPGQTEQEYLAEQLKNKKIFYSSNQDDFDLIKALSESVSFTGFSNIESESRLLSLALDDVLK